MPGGHSLHVFVRWSNRSPASHARTVVVVAVVVVRVLVVSVNVVDVVVVAVVVVGSKIWQSQLHRDDPELVSLISRVSV